MAVSINGNGTVTGLTDLTSGDLTVDTNTLHVDSTNNRVGVGTTTPTTALDVSGTVNATAFTGDGSALTGVGNETITLSGDVTGSGTTAITVTVVDDSHNHIISNVDGLQTALDGKQPLDADLTAIGGLAKTDGNFIVGNGTTWVAESGATARTSLGLGSLATLSSVDAATITDNSVGAAELNVSGNGTTSQFLRSDGDGSFTWAGAGKVLQVLQSVKSDAFSTTSTSLVDVSGLSVSITPSSTSSKILVHVDLMVTANYYVGYAQLVRNSTQIYKGDTASNRPTYSIAFGQNPSNDGISQRSSIMYLDSPSTTSATTYKIQALARPDNAGGGTFYINRTVQDRDTNTYDPRGVSSITVIEIGA